MNRITKNNSLCNDAMRSVTLLCMMCFVPFIYAQTSDDLEPDVGRIVWVGPEQTCDYPNLQQAVANIYDCGPFGCPPGIPRIRLSDNYNHSGPTLLDKSLKIQGGFSSCGDNFIGENKTLSPIHLGFRLFTITAPPGQTIQIELQRLKMLGTLVSQGGVILINEGAVTLRLIDSIVTGGTAEEGGGIAMLGGGNLLEIHNSVIANNRAINSSFGDGDGGGIYCENGGEIQFISGEIRDNKADTRGGGLRLLDCQLIGQNENKDRLISNNIVLRSTAPDALGKGGGVYASGPDALIQLGGLVSRTQIKHNRVAEWQPDSFPPNRATGGGLHLQTQARAELSNVQFIGNQAPNGGAISIKSGASLLMDRSSGPCLAPRDDECSAMIDNVATGTFFTGFGSALYARADTVGVEINRTVFRGNSAYNYNGNAASGSMIYYTTKFDSSISLKGNLMFLNTIEEGHNESDGNYLVFGQFNRRADVNVDLIQNTIAFNGNADNILKFYGVSLNAIGNLIFEPNQDQGIMGGNSIPAVYSACNVTGPIGEYIKSVVWGGGNRTVSDAGFLNYHSADFRLHDNSKAINKCDEQDGAIDMSFDILGRFRPIVTGPDNDGLGNYDAGAFEYHPNIGGDVDLQAGLEIVTLTGPTGAVFKASLRNIGVSPARHSSTYILFEKPASDYSTSGDWNCNERMIGGTEMVECRHLTIGSGNIPVLGHSSLLTVHVTPDNSSECGLVIFAESRGLNRDTDLSNNSTEYDSTECQLSEMPILNDIE